MCVDAIAMQPIASRVESRLRPGPLVRRCQLALALCCVLAVADGVFAEERPSGSVEISLKGYGRLSGARIGFVRLGGPGQDRQRYLVDAESVLRVPDWVRDERHAVSAVVLLGKGMPRVMKFVAAGQESKWIDMGSSRLPRWVPTKYLEPIGAVVQAQPERWILVPTGDREARRVEIHGEGDSSATEGAVIDLDGWRRFPIGDKGGFLGVCRGGVGEKGYVVVSRGFEPFTLSADDVVGKRDVDDEPLVVRCSPGHRSVEASISIEDRSESPALTASAWAWDDATGVRVGEAGPARSGRVVIEAAGSGSVTVLVAGVDEEGRMYEGSRRVPPGESGMEVKVRLRETRVQYRSADAPSVRLDCGNSLNDLVEGKGRTARLRQRGGGEGIQVNEGEGLEEIVVPGPYELVLTSKKGDVEDVVPVEVREGLVAIVRGGGT